MTLVTKELELGDLTLLSGRLTASSRGILESIRRQLIKKIEEANESTCYITEQEAPTTAPSGRYVITVSEGNSNYPREFYSGGGLLTVDAVINVAVFIFGKSDRPHRKAERTIGSEDENGANLFKFKKQIIKALITATETNQDGNPVGWEPWEQVSDTEARYLLRDQLQPLSSSGPRDFRIGMTQGTGQTHSFSCVYDMDLS